MRKSFVRLICCAVLSSAALENADATGGFAPQRWLENGGVASDMSPEFYWGLELKRMAKEFRPPEKRVVPDAEKPQAAQGDPAGAVSPGTKLTSQADTTDFDDAIKSGTIKPSDPAKAKAAHEAARQFVSIAKETTTDALPEELASEFADYHRGAYAFRKGEAHFAEARAAWEALLKRPKDERHYRTVWTAFMLGKLALAAKDPDAVKWFRQTRELAKDGFADSLGLAADSYGWEARSELKQGHDETAAKLYLTQLALGDESAIVSLKAIIPDRPHVEGMKNYGEYPAEDSTPEQIKQWNEAQAPKTQARLDTAARSPLLRRLVTVHVLATETQEQIWSYGADSNPDGEKAGDRCRRWLATLNKAGLKEIEDADHLGWVAYTAGRYKEAASWLAIAKQETATALWLKAKLQRREGKLADATQTMAAAFKLITGEKAPREDNDSIFIFGENGYRIDQSAAGDLAGLHLSRGDFVNAMAAFLAGDLWDDAAFVGDRVLTVDELKKYVDDHFRDAAPVPQADDSGAGDRPKAMRWMLARRLVREDRYVEARAYFPKEEQAVLDRYVAALKEADNTRLAKPDRARALFTAAWIARHDGMELMGTEVEPDGFVSGGNFAPGSVDSERAEGVTLSKEYDDAKRREVVTRKPIKLSIPVTPEEKQRIAKNRPHPANRFHYRWVASALAWKAASLLPDGTEELADVLNKGGSWIQDRDAKGADKFIQAIERRCAKTKIGQTASKKHWFTDFAGPWSESLDKQAEAAKAR